MINEGGAWHPLTITPADAGTAGGQSGLLTYLDGLADFGAMLTEHKAIVFRDFAITPETLEPVLDELLPNRLAYVHGNSPRTKIGQNVYTSTEYPAQFTISMHNELSYAAQWPSRLLFFCEYAAETGGATPVVDAALWLELLDPEVREAFAGGVRYNQNLHDGLGLGKSWQATFETEKREEVDDFLEQAGAEWRWTKHGLRISQTRPSTTRHPETGVEVWFNQSDQWHPAALGDETAIALAKVMPEDDLPQSVTFADGKPIPAEYVVQVRDRALDAAVDVDWQAGDVLLIDNVLVGHGRRPYTGKRRVLVAMSR